VDRNDGKSRVPMQNMAIRSPSVNLRISVRTASSETAAALNRGKATPPRSAPNAIAFARSMPERIPPLPTIGVDGHVRRTC
jgi:hypothetical protein